jgi:V-type H+-transporting ATPase subunit E
MQSNAKNQRRLQILKEQDLAVQKVLRKAHSQLAVVSQPGEQYQKLLYDLIIQAAVLLEQPVVEVVCRRSDVSMVQAVLAQASAESSKRINKQIKLSVSSQHLTDIRLVSGC